MEKLRYPYEPGKCGINFEEILQRFKKGKREGVVIGGSGRILKYEIEENRLSVSDWDSCESRIISAGVNNSIATFGLITRVSKMDKELQFPWERHPDLFAGKFVGLALQHFKNTNVKVDICKGIWERSSDNYATYMEKLKQTGNKVIAAKSTWSGRTFIKHGFSKLSKRDIDEDDLGSVIEASFHRSTKQ